MSSNTCPALFISAPGSGHGKTTTTAAIAWHHTQQGRKIRVFKTGPDFLDPMVLEYASNQPVYQLDLWMIGEKQCQRLIYEAANDADLILIEGVMGLFDGNPCSADLAELLNIPVMTVIDCRGSAQTIGAIAYGLANFRQQLPFAGVLANSVASTRHEEMISAGFKSDINYLGSLPKDLQISLPERHLGLVQAQEVNDLDKRLSKAALSIKTTKLAELPPAIAFCNPNLEPAPKLLNSVRIGIARDAAFSFIYQANLDFLQSMGAILVFFSPLTDPSLPEVDSLYFPGGYPEMYLQQLHQNQSLTQEITTHFNLGKPIYAECGGMLYLLDSLTDKSGNTAKMVGVLPGEAVMENKIKGLGYQSASLPGGVIKGHAFHHSVMQTPLKEFSTGLRLYNTSPGEKVFLVKRLIASYLHLYFPSDPNASAQLFLP